ncbi:alpha/beta fold hydrolase [Nocardioides sp. LHG3406-4]|uniref:alpha/beta hydrolase n=1 Tax=Nocardioides sp. LHG3406-4 TaxID=2804575 RepID=UPI003CFA63F9
MDIVLVPGMWLNASTWDRVAPLLEAEGHRPHALTLPGMESKGADRSGITLDDHVAAVVATIDAADGPVLLVGHSAGCGIAHLALDARPDRVTHVVHVGGFPPSDGETLLGGFEAIGGEVTMPDWAEKGEDANLIGFSDAQLAAFYAAAIPEPQGVMEGVVRLHDDRRYGVPVTMVCPEYTAEDLRGWVKDGHVPELARPADVAYVDVPTGHWPQLTRPADLAKAILGAVPA